MRALSILYSEKFVFNQIKLIEKKEDSLNHKELSIPFSLYIEKKPHEYHPETQSSIAWL